MNPLLTIVNLSNTRSNRLYTNLSTKLTTTTTPWIYSLLVFPINVQPFYSSLHHTEETISLFYMIEYLFSSLPPGKGVDLAEAGLSSIMANIALVVGVIILKPAIEQHIHPAIWGHTPTYRCYRRHCRKICAYSCPDFPRAVFLLARIGRYGLHDTRFGWNCSCFSAPSTGCFLVLTVFGELW